MVNAAINYFEYGQREIDYLTNADPVLGAAIERLGKPEREIIPDLFTALVNAMVGQLISVKAADAIWGRMLERLGSMTPQRVAEQSVADIKGCGLSLKKAENIHAIASSIMSGELNLHELTALPDAEVAAKLTSLKGVGHWTAEMLLIHALERPDVVSWGDAAIRRGMMRLYGLSELTKQQFEEYRKLYSPYGSVASIYLWQLSAD
ncbi:DNA-3-methyladenine glycosylase family protein [Paenibacillus harenae]|uniref:DNA-3-methyladenine glycosylase II n=1 Tax=Paenibacillus harenae TaxID=306543 RepID=A0ABT9U0P2_PAEHA|nr:DNA-3-methyladenine glycosylase 2 family protein [Paenibacillus harenae]MDQ0059212.1 DNA-3-methyladenine glycosylase II [Paenibacillus harenae]MDQ0112676.1 DNA-3-methyladenine glycosylase II [Paenibacillus harenae]